MRRKPIVPVKPITYDLPDIESEPDDPYKGYDSGEWVVVSLPPLYYIEMPWTGWKASTVQ